MKRGITYYWGKDHLLITLGNRTQGRILILFLSEFLLTAGMATIFLLRSIPFSGGFTHMVSGIGASLLYLLAAYRFLSRIFFNEQLLLDGQSLTIIKKTLFVHRADRYEWQHTGMLHYAGKSPKTDHPLKGKCFDYLGFETQEQLTQNLHQPGNLYFNYKGEPVYFASGVYSWDAEEVVRIMKLFTGASLRLGPEWEQMLQEQEMGDY